MRSVADRNVVMRRMTVTWRYAASCRQRPAIRQHPLNHVLSTTATSFPARNLQSHDPSSRRRQHATHKCWYLLSTTSHGVTSLKTVFFVTIYVCQSVWEPIRPPITQNDIHPSQILARPLHTHASFSGTGCGQTQRAFLYKSSSHWRLGYQTSERSNSWHTMNSTLWSNPDCIQKFNDSTQRI